MYNEISESVRKTWNLAIEIQRTVYENTGGYITPNDMDWYMTNKLKDKYPFIGKCKSSIRQHMLKDMHVGYKMFFKGISRIPHFKSYRNPIKSIYLVNAKTFPIKRIDERHIQIPYFHSVKCGFCPEFNNKIYSGRLVCKNNIFYIHLRICVEKNKFCSNPTDPIGIDMGIKRLITINRPIIDTSFTRGLEYVQTYPKLSDINCHISHYENRIRRLQRAICKKYRVHEKMYNEEKFMFDIANLKKDSLWIKTYHTKNIDKLQEKINRCYTSITNIRRDYERKIIKSIINNRPSYIVIEDIDIMELIKKSPSKYISSAIYSSRWFNFRIWLTKKCDEFGIELRIADKKFKSSKICSNCGHVHKNLTIKDRIYECPKCGFIEDRDINAAINLVSAKEYDIA